MDHTVTRKIATVAVASGLALSMVGGVGAAYAAEPTAQSGATSAGGDPGGGKADLFHAIHQLEKAKEAWDAAAAGATVDPVTRAKVTEARNKGKASLTAEQVTAHIDVIVEATADLGRTVDS